MKIAMCLITHTSTGKRSFVCKHTNKLFCIYKCTSAFKKIKNKNKRFLKKPEVYYL